MMLKCAAKADVYAFRDLEHTKTYYSMQMDMQWKPGGAQHLDKCFVILTRVMCNDVTY